MERIFLKEAFLESSYDSVFTAISFVLINSFYFLYKTAKFKN